MAWGKKKNPPARLLLTDARGNALFDAPMSQLRFEEDCVLRLSVEFYNDSAPCEIHRSAVMHRALLEIEQALAPGNPTRIEALPPRVAGFLGCYPGVDQLFLRKEDA